MTRCALVGAWWGYHAAALARVPVVTISDLPASGATVFCLNVSERIADDLLERHRFINVHCAPLPYGRGGGPIENLIRLGHVSTVLTAHQMTTEMDAGPIYGVAGPVSLDGNKTDIQARFIQPVAHLMRWILETEPEPVPQVGEVMRFSRLSPEHYEAFWSDRG